MGYRVCVADDCEDTTALLCEGLRSLDYEAIGVHSGAEALEVCGRGGIDLILLDVCLPDIDGYEVCRRIKESPATHDIVVVFVTVRGDGVDISRGYALGAADYITKPFNLPMVLVRTEAAMRTRHLPEASLRGDVLGAGEHTDYLTGLRSKHYLLERLQEEAERAHRYDYPVSCVMFDLDEVRAADNELGAASLDDLLVEVGMTLRNHSRGFDILARYDDTMFASVLPHAPLEHAVGYATKILREVEATTFCDPCFPTIVGMSVGIVACRNGSALGAEYVLGEAMRGLLQAKSRTGERLVARNLTER